MNWIPVTERMPIDDRPVLVYRPDCGDIEIARYMSKQNWGWMRKDYFLLDGVTHWFYLPDRPAAEQEATPKPPLVFGQSAPGNRLHHAPKHRPLSLTGAE